MRGDWLLSAFPMENMIESSRRLLSRNIMNLNINRREKLLRKMLSIKVAQQLLVPKNHLGLQMVAFSEASDEELVKLLNHPCCHKHCTKTNETNTNS